MRMMALIRFGPIPIRKTVARKALRTATACPAGRFQNGGLIAARKKKRNRVAPAGYGIRGAVPTTIETLGSALLDRSKLPQDSIRNP
jgi:hypothetical protein